MIEQVDPKFYELPPRTLLMKRGSEEFILVIRRKSRIIMKDALTILKKADKIKEKALSFDKWKKEELDKMPGNELTSLIFHTGISTADNSDLISGRGVGMNLIKQKIEEHGGSIEVESKTGEFCNFKLILPSQGK